MEMENVLLGELRELLAYLGGPGSEARLDMAYWSTCVAAYAVRNGHFNRLGLRWEGAWIVFGPDSCFTALQRFFGLTDRQTDYLFADTSRYGYEAVGSFAEAVLRIDEILEGEI